MRLRRKRRITVLNSRGRGANAQHPTAGIESPRWIGSIRQLAPVLLCVFTSSLVAAEPSSSTGTIRSTDSQDKSVYMPGAKVSARWATVKRRVVDTSAENWRVRYRLTDARPIREARTVESSVIQAQFTTPVAPLTPPVAPPRELKPPVRVVNQLAPLDPFDDPFGDRSPAPEEAVSSPAELPPPPIQVPISLQPDPSTQPDSVPPEAAPTDEEAAPVLPLEPAPSADSARPRIPCDRVYNARNCCESEDRCRRAQEAVLGRPISDISVDITPLLTVAKAAAGERTYEQERAISLAEAPSRAWRDRNGELLADGRLVDFRDGRIVILQADGESVQLPFARLSEDDSCFVIAWWGIPSECRLASNDIVGRNWIATTMTWKASALCHKPLYFEDVQLERYGHTAGPIAQPVLSGAHFFLNVATLPYKMGINPPNECQYALGYYRPGNCAPWLVPPIPLSVRGALLQAGTVVGGVFVLP